MNIVCVGFPKWEGEYLKSTVQLMQALAERHHVLYVDYAYTISDVWRSLSGKRNFPVSRILGVKDRLERIDVQGKGSLHVLRLSPVLPTRWINNNRLHDKVVDLFSWVHAKQIRRAIRRVGMKEWHMINAFQPVYGVGLGKYLNPISTTYYCYDEISAAQWISKHGSRLEKKFASSCDLVITSSDPLKESKIAFNSNTEVIKNGVDPTYFKKPRVPVMPSDIPYTKGNVIGYIGTIDDRLDLDILKYLFDSRPDDQFLFIGRCTNSETGSYLASFQNVHLLGPKPLSQLKHYLYHFDVGIIPFVKNEFTRCIYPLKINEYLIQGKPVVTTPFSDLSDFETLVEIADSGDLFSSALDRCLGQSNPRLHDQRVRFASNNTWSARSLELEEALCQYTAA